MPTYTATISVRHTDGCAWHSMLGSRASTRSEERRVGKECTRDYSKWMTAEDILNNVKRYARPGSIITFHDSLKAIEKLRTALPQSIEWLKEQGYTFKTFE